MKHHHQCQLKFLEFNGAAKSGDDFIVLDSEKEAKNIK